MSNVPTLRAGVCEFGFRHFFVIRHSCFVIGDHSKAANSETVTPLLAPRARSFCGNAIGQRGDRPSVKS